MFFALVNKLLPGAHRQMSHFWIAWNINIKHKDVLNKSGLFEAGSWDEAPDG